MEKNNYDIVLLDIMMPVLNGIEFMKKISENPKPKSTKIILLSNLASAKEIEEALSLGADKSVLKASITPRSLIDMIHAELIA